jgi:hypothetical protein
VESADPSPPLPTFVVAGTQRSGTTALWHWLGAHPDVFVASAKELHFFDTNWQDGVDSYRQSFHGWGGQPAIGEVTPNYIFDADAVSRMVEVMPDVRVVVSLREPVERAYSHYWARRSRAFETREFADVIAAEPAEVIRSKGSGYLLARGRYLGQIERALEVLPREHLLVVLFDDLEQRPTETFAEICRFVGVDDQVVPAEVGRPANAHRQFRSQRVRRLTLRLPGPTRDLVGRINSRAVGYPPLDPALRRELVERFRPDNEALASWLGRDLSAWLA